jgi:hypothetical protein
VTDRKKFKYQTKSEAKASLLASIIRVITAFPALEKALNTNSLNDDQWGHFRYYADQINQANSMVKALGVEIPELSDDLQELITQMDSLGNRILNHKGSSDLTALKDMAKDGSEIMFFAQDLEDKLRPEFQKKRYFVF